MDYVVVAAAILTIAAFLLIRSSGPRDVLSQKTKDQFMKFPLIQKTVLSHNTAVYRFGLPKPDARLGLPIGQHISIRANIDGKDVVRSYTPTSGAETKGHFDLLIKSYEQGNVSRVVGELEIGQSLEFRGPKGFYNYVENSYESIGMIAGGTGIAPMYQIINAIASNPADKTKVKLVYGNQTEADILLKQELDEIVAKNPEQFSVHYMLDRPAEGWTGGKGYVTAEVLQEHMPKVDSSTQILLCGPPPMTSGSKRLLHEMGFERAKPISKSGDQVFVF